MTGQLCTLYIYIHYASLAALPHSSMLQWNICIKCVGIILSLNFEEVAGAYWFRVMHPCVRPCIHSSKTMNARVLKFHIWIPQGKIVDTCFFFLSELFPFLELSPFEKIRMESDACHILWTVYARVLKFHIWIPHGKIADLYFFSCPSYLPFWSYAPLKKSEWNLVSKISRKVFELGAWNMLSW